MKVSAVAVILTGLLGVTALATEPSVSVSPAEVGRLALAAALLDYPVEQVRLRDALGIPAGVHSTGGGYENEGARKGAYDLWPLTQDAAGGRYSLKTYYSGDTMETTGRYPLIITVEVVYSANYVGSFVADPNQYPLLMAPRLKVLMKRDGLTPKEITEPKTLRKYWDEAIRDQANEFSARQKKRQPIQATEPATPGASGRGTP